MSTPKMFVVGHHQDTLILILSTMTNSINLIHDYNLHSNLYVKGLFFSGIYEYDMVTCDGSQKIFIRS